MQLIYYISKQEVSVNRDGNLQAIDFYARLKCQFANQDWQEWNVTDRWLISAQNKQCLAPHLLFNWF